MQPTTTTTLWCIIFVLLTTLNLNATSPETNRSESIKFVENKGQWNDNILFKLRFKTGALFLEKDKFTYLFISGEDWEHVHDAHHGEAPSDDLTINGHVFKVHFQNSNPVVEVEGSDEFPFYHNYFIGNDPSRWTSNTRIFNTVTYEDIYPNIDLEISGSSGNLKYSFIVKPGGDPTDIDLFFEGLEDLFIDNGELHYVTSVNTIYEEQPVSFQQINGELVPIQSKFHLDNNDHLSFALPDGYNSAHKLIIDPVLVFGSYTGSLADNFGYTATYDDQENFYAGGIARAAGYPTTVGAFQSTYAGGVTVGNFDLGFNADIAITKFNSTGTQQIYSTYLGGSVNDQPHSMVVNSAGELHVYGRSNSTDYPVTATALDGTHNGNMDIVVTKFNAAGSALMGSTYVGGTDDDGANISPAPFVRTSLKFNYADDARGEVILDDQGNVYVASSTRSSDFPVTGGAFQTSLGGSQDGCVFKLNSNLSAFVWSSYIGGNLDDAAYALALDASNNVYTAGGTNSTNFTTTAGALNTTFQGGQADGFISLINSNGASILNSSYIGTSQYDQTYFVQLDGDGDVYILGQTSGSYPVTAGVYTNPGSGQYITGLRPNLGSINFSTVFGKGDGDPDISPTAFLVDRCRNIYASGWGGTTNNSGTNWSTTGLPVTADAFQSTTDGSDFYFIVFTEDAATLEYATFFGGPISSEHVDGGTSRFDKNGVIYQAVCAGCGGNDDFPTTPGAWSNLNLSQAPQRNCNLGAAKFKFQLIGVDVDIQANPDTSGCPPFEVSFAATGVNAKEYFWILGDGTISHDSAFVHTYDDPGTYPITLIGLDSTSCDGLFFSDTSHATIIVFPSLVTADAGPDQSICAGDSVTLTATGGSSYAWSTGALTPSTSVGPIVTTEYRVTVMDVNGCEDSDSVTVVVRDPVTTSISEEICEGDSLFVGGSFQTEEGTYYDTLLASNGCDSVVVTTLSFISSTSWTNIYGDANANIYQNGYYDAGEDAYFIAGRNTGSSAFLSKIDRFGNHLWTRTYAVSISNGRTFIVRAPNKDFLLSWVNSSDDIFIMRVDSVGNVVWANTYQRTGRERLPYLVNSIGDSYLVGGWISGGGDDALIMRIDSLGNILWANRYDDLDDEMTDFAPNGSGGCLLAGREISAGQFERTFLAEFSVSGTPTFLGAISVTNGVVAHGIIKTQDGGYAVTGKIGTTWTNMNDAFLLKLDANWNTQWIQRVTGLGGENRVSPPIQDIHGYYYVPTKLLVGNVLKAAVVKYDPNGNYLWTKSFDYLVTGAFDQIKLTNSNTPNELIYVIGRSPVAPGGFGNYDGFLARLDTSLISCISEPINPTRSTDNWSVVNAFPATSPVSFNIIPSNPAVTDLLFSQGQLCPTCFGCINVTDSIVASICEGDSLFAGGDFQTVEGTYIDSLLTADGCDSVIVTELAVLENPVTTIQEEVCTSDTSLLGIITSFDTLIAANSCDSIVITETTYLPIQTRTDEVTICQGESYPAGGDLQTETGIYFDTLTAANGCDSIIITDLTVLPTSSTTLDVLICEGESHFAGGADQTETGTYIDSLFGANGCDSIVTTNLTVSEVDVTFDVTNVSCGCGGTEDSSSVVCSFSFEGLPHGTILNNQFASEGITISGDAYGGYADQVIVFNSNLNNTADPDLEANLGNLAIFPTTMTDNNGDGLVDIPDDQGAGGVMVFTFDSDRTVYSLVMVDNENNNGTIRAYDASNTLIASINTPSSVNGSVQTININVSGVRRLEVDYRDSRGITDLRLSCPGDRCPVNMDDLAHGTILNNQFASEGITISGDAPGANIDQVIIFNSNLSGTPDPDLEVNIGNLIIFPLNVTDNNGDGLVDAPNDNAAGGNLIFTFDRERTVYSFTFVDNDRNSGTVRAYDGSNSLLATITVPSSGNGTVQVVPVNVSGVRRLEIEYSDSRGVANLVLDCDEPCCDGAVTAIPVGGIPPFEYLWDNGVTTATLDSLCEGTYTVTITDSIGCVTVDSVIIGQDEGFMINVSAEICIGDSLFLGGGYQMVSGTYFDTIPGPFGCDSIITTELTVYPSYIDTLLEEICEGDSFFAAGSQQTVSGAYLDSYSTVNGCDSTILTLLTVHPNPDVLIVFDTVCAGDSTTFINLSTGIDPDAIYIIDVFNDGIIEISAPASQIPQQGADIFPEGISEFKAIVTNSTGCSDTFLTQIVVLANSDTANLSLEICEGDSVFAEGAWQTESGIYTDIFVAANGCDSISVLNLTVFPIDTFLQQIFICDGDSFFAGGNFQTASGTYFDVFTGFNSCDSIVQTELVVSSELILSAVKTNVNCTGGNDGEIDLTVSGGILPYFYIWSHGPITEDITGLSVGQYSVTVTDSIGCEATLSEDITEPAPLALGATSEPVSCFGGTDGSIDLTVLGGTPPYSYLWSTGDNTEDISGLVADTFSVTVTDSLGCNATVLVIVQEPQPISLSAIITDESITGANDGAIDLSVSGGTSPYIYNWSTGDTTEDISGLPEGSYFITITDNYGCIGIDSFNILSPIINNRRLHLCNDSIFAGGEYQLLPGVYFDTLTASTGQDSIIVTELIDGSILQDSIISGIVNNYASVLSIDTQSCNAQIIVGDITGFSECGKILIIQMKGALIDSSNSPSYGTIQNYRAAGNYEFATVQSINGTTIVLNESLSRNYDISGLVQVISVPVYEQVTVNGALSAQPWDGVTGGVITLEVLGTLNLNSNIDASGLGFRAGMLNNSVVCINNNEPNYYYNLTSTIAAQKGEGIATYILNQESGKGPLANGGGGGQCKNGGGAGGGNYGAGGIGGMGFNLLSNTSIPSGLGGNGLQYNININKIFLGGGGGSGHQDDVAPNLPVGTQGTNGGGIIIIVADSIDGNGIIKSNGQDQILVAGSDGAGGAGAGGTVLLDVEFINSTISVQAKGGNGGDNDNQVSSGNTPNNYCVAPGGGGGGGIVWSSGPSAGLSIDVSGGEAGLVVDPNSPCFNTSFGAGPGQDGAVLNDLAIIESGACDSTNSPLPPENQPRRYFSIKIYPNPFNNSLYMKFYSDRNGEAQLKMANILGKQVVQQSFFAEEGENERELLFRQSLPSGVYLLEFRLGEHREVIKLISE